MDEDEEPLRFSEAENPLVLRGLRDHTQCCCGMEEHRAGMPGFVLGSCICKVMPVIAEISSSL